MNFEDINFKIVIATLLIALVFLLSVKYLYNWYNLESPLENALAKDNRIQSFSIDKSADTFKISVILNNKFDDLSEVYSDLKNTLESILKNRNYRLDVKGLENEKLQAAYYNMHFSLYENIIKNNFIKIDNDIKKIADQYAISEYKIIIDRENVYLMLRDKENGLYKIIEREKD